MKATGQQFNKSWDTSHACSYKGCIWPYHLFKEKCQNNMQCQVCRGTIIALTSNSTLVLNGCLHDNKGARFIKNDIPSSASTILEPYCYAITICNYSNIVPAKPLIEDPQRYILDNPNREVVGIFYYLSYKE